MTKPSQPGMPGFGQMSDTLDFVKRLWGGMSVPGMVVPTVSVDELNQKIADLKTVETWLNLNLSMLRSTIQAMEVQSATLSTIQSMGAAMGAAMKPGEDGKPSFANFFPPPPAEQKDSGKGAASPFAYPNWPAPAPKPEPVGTSSSAAAKASQPAPQPAPQPTQGPAAQTATQPAADSAKGSESAAGTGTATAAMPDFSTAMAAPSAWWNMLQNQFMQAVSQAMADSKETMNVAAKAASSVKPAVKPAAKEAAKPAAKSSGKSAAGETAKSAGNGNGSAGASRSSSSAAKSTDVAKPSARKPKS